MRMKKNNTRISLFLPVLIFLMYVPSPVLSGELKEGSDNPSFWVAEIDLEDRNPPEGSMSLIKPGLEDTLQALGNLEIVTEPGASDAVLISRLTDYSLETGSDLNFIVRLQVELTISGAFESAFSIECAGIGDTAYTAAKNAADDVHHQFSYLLRDSLLWQPALRVMDIAAGMAVLNRGSASGIYPGREFSDTEKGRGELFLKVSRVYEDFSLAHMVRRPADLIFGQLLYAERRVGIKSSIQGRFLLVSSGEEDQKSTWSVLTRSYFQRGLFALNPFIGLEYADGESGFAHFGMGLNWYAGPFLFIPAMGGQTGFARSDGGSFIWGGFSEIALEWIVSRRLVLHGDAGVSRLYAAGSNDEDRQIIYAGLGLMLKY